MVVYKKQTGAMDADELVKIEDTSSSEDEDRPATSRKRTAVSFGWNETKSCILYLSI